MLIISCHWAVLPVIYINWTIIIGLHQVSSGNTELIILAINMLAQQSKEFEQVLCVPLNYLICKCAHSQHCLLCYRILFPYMYINTYMSPLIASEYQWLMTRLLLWIYEHSILSSVLFPIFVAIINVHVIIA